MVYFICRQWGGSTIHIPNRPVKVQEQGRLEKVRCQVTTGLVATRRRTGFRWPMAFSTGAGCSPLLGTQLGPPWHRRACSFKYKQRKLSPVPQWPCDPERL